MDEHGFSYIEVNDNLQRVDFAECYQNYLTKRLSQEAYELHRKANPTLAFSYEKYAARVKSWTEVGARNILGGASNWWGMHVEEGSPWMLFYTDIPTLLIFPGGEAFEETRIKIHRQWSTFDLT